VISTNWEQLYKAERARLLDALGQVTDGGIIESIQHIGATSIPGLHGSACIDIVRRSRHLPTTPGFRSYYLDRHRLAALEKLHFPLVLFGGRTRVERA
jgi:GrpB-like predicted nucleotidyltransferase (UPF0157 family)